MKYFYQINKILTKKQKRAAIFLTLLMLVSMAFEVLTLNSLFVLLSYMTNSSTLEDSHLIAYLKNINLNYDINLLIAALFVFIFTLKTLINIFISWKQNRFTFFIRAELSHLFFSGYLCLPSIFHLRTNTSDLIKNITIEVEHFSHALNALLIIAMEIVILLGLSAFLLFIDLKITILSIVSHIFFSLVINFFNAKKILSMGKKRVKIVQLRLKSIIEGFSGSKVFELTGSQKNLIGNFSIYNNDIAKIASNVSFRMDLLKPLFELFVLLLIGIIFIFNFENQSGLKNIVPLLGVFLTAAYRLVPSFGRILSNIQKFQYNVQAAEKLSKDIEKFDSQNREINKNSEKFDFKESVRFENAGFSYVDDLEKDSNFVLKDIDLNIKKGSKIGIIGHSGSGKSTFLDLIMGLIFSQKGKILIDGKKIESVKSSWQKNIGCVPQDVFILDDTLKRNIAFGLPNELIDEKKVNKAIDLANLTEFKNSLQSGLETFLGESGSRLSGGQRQRIGIARALYNSPNVLIFDEATNALDVETEKKIINEIFSLKEGNTIIFVSHNKDNLIFCDLIYEVRDRNLFSVN